MGRPWALGLLALALPLAACKPKAPSDAPSRDVRSWTLAEIEAELAHNDQALAGEGIVVAMADPAPTPEPGPSSEEATPTGGPLDHDDGAEPPSEPSDLEAQPSEPTAMPSVSPQAEMSPDEGLSASAPERVESQRRMTARARRDAETRCERICALAEATCELEAQICELAARHPEEPRYHQACLRAEQQCEAASRACQRCED